MATHIDQSYYNEWPQVEFPNDDDSKEVVTSDMRDPGSISFGRFSVESLSWERRSVFIHNRHQEELEKFNGLVAKKKAYFEERYRRIRASKLSKNSEQIELTLDYEGDGATSSNSSRTDEENESNSKHRRPRESEIDVVDATLEEAKVNDMSNRELSYNEASNVVELNSEVLPQEISLSEESIVRIEPAESSNGDTHVEPVDIESLSLNERVEKIEDVDKGRIIDEGLKLENVAQKVANRTVNKGQVKGIKNSESNNSRSIRKPLYSKTANNVKGSTVVASAPRNGRMLDRSTKKDTTQTPNSAKLSLKKITGKAENIQNAGNRRIVEKADNNHKGSALALSNQSHAELHSKIVAPSPSTVVRERRTSSRASSMKVDTVNSVKLPSSATIRANNGLKMQDVSKKMGTVSGVTSRGVEVSKRLISEVKNTTKKPLVIDSKQTNIRRNEVPMQRTVKSRLSTSVNLPTGSFDVRAKSQLSTLKSTKQEGKLTNQTISKSLGSSMNGNTKIVSKKPTQAQQNEKNHGGNKQRFDNLSLDGRRTRTRDNGVNRGLKSMVNTISKASR